MAPHNERTVVAKAILQYLAAHEQAADTAAGVARWWMGRDSQRAPSLEIVEEALAELIRAGELEQRQLPDGTTIYCRAGRQT